MKQEWGMAVLVVAGAMFIPAAIMIILTHL